MSKQGMPFQRELAKVEVMAELRQALDLKHGAICEAARRDWEYLFGPKDPADACVTVRVVAATTSAIHGAGFLKSRRKRVSKAQGLPRFAH
jgi:hypothetical protein